MCVLASAVDIFSSHPSRGGDQQELVTASLRYSLASAFDTLAHQYNWCDIVRM